MRRTRFMLPSRTVTQRLPSRARAISISQHKSDAAGSWVRPVTWTLACAGAAMAMLALTPQAHAQVFSSQPYVAAPDPAVEQLRLRLEALEADLRKAVDEAETLGAQLSDARRIAEAADAGRRRAEADIELLKDRVETLEEEVQGVPPPKGDAGLTPAPQPQSQSKPAQRATAAPNAPAAAPAPPAAPTFDTAALPQDEEGMFAQSHALLIDGNYSGAETAFTGFLSKYPKSKSAADAQYYLGESLLYQDDYPAAAGAYGKLIKDYPTSSNAPTGLVKLARAMRLMDKRTEACRTLELMGKNFPKASAVAKQMAAQERQYAKCT